MWLLQRRLARGGVTKKSKKDRARDAVTIVAKRSLAPKTQLVVVEIDNVRYVLGVGEGGVSVIDSRPTDGTAAPDVPASAPRLAPVRALRSSLPSADTDTAAAPVTTAASDVATATAASTDTPGSLPLRRAHREAHREAQREARPTFGAALSREASQALRRAIGA
ncbi:flagellar biosynthetic protein FliO [Microbacterium sp. LjRoot45]|uniref:flagellar biosynthetic protein FliO n=1 Tax=Microbacterium sp. LjRoot45 TaxID=3342329 RepID=UPI003ED02A4E